MRDGPASLSSSLLARKGQARPAALPDDDILPYVEAEDGAAVAANSGGDSGAARLAAAAKRASAAPNDMPEAALTEVKVSKPRRMSPRPAEALPSEPVLQPHPAEAGVVPDRLPATLPAVAGLAAVVRPDGKARPARRLWQGRWRSHWTVFGVSFLVGAAAAVAYWLSQSPPAPVMKEIRTPVELAAVAPVSEPAAEPRAAVPATTATPPVPAEPVLPQVGSVRFAGDGRPLVDGTAAPGSRVLLLDNGRLLATLDVGVDGTWSFAGRQALAAGPHNFTVAALAGTVAASLSAPAAATPARPDTGGPDTGGPGTGGPADLFAGDIAVPAEKPARLEAADQEQVASTGDAAAAGTYVVQLASLPDEASADRFWSKLQKDHPRLMKDRAMQLDGATLANGAAVYRVRTGEFATLDEAQRLCRRFRTVRRDCLVVRRLETRS